MNAIKKVILIISIIALIFIGYYLITRLMYAKVITDNVSANKVEIGGNFSLQNQDEEMVTQDGLLGKYTIVLFGFSRCPHICPNQLSMLSQALDENKNLQAFFISVDPENDTVEKLAKFKKDFHPKIQMLTGDKKTIDKIVKDYKVYVQKSDNPEEFNHSTVMYLMAPDGNYKTHFTPASEEELAIDVQKEINNS